MVSMPHSLLWDLYFAHARPPAVVVAIGVRSQCSPVGIEVEICPTTLRGLPTRYGYNACRSPHPRCTPGLNRNLGYLSRPQQPRTRTLLDPQTPIPPPLPPQLCSRHVSEPGYPPRGRGGKKRTCSRPRRTHHLPSALRGVARADPAGSDGSTQQRQNYASHPGHRPKLSSLDGIELV